VDDIAGTIDHTLVRPDATPAQVAQLCDEAMRHGFYAVAVNEAYVRQAGLQLQGSGVLVACAIGFPFGATSVAVKCYEIEQAIAAGARELDVVINIGAVKGGLYNDVEQEIVTLTRACHLGGARCKIILETAYLTEAEKVCVCRLAVAAGADFVKTSTGYAPQGATVPDVALMRREVGPHVGVKAAGGIRSYAQARALLAAGANRLGVSAASSLQILAEQRALQMGTAAALVC
jgi:deoxyribose-phosphate aldolase